MWRRKLRCCEYSECSINTCEEIVNTYTNLAPCSRCQIVYYCCVEHQRLHWKEHKKICKPLIIDNTEGDEEDDCEYYDNDEDDDEEEEDDDEDEDPW